MSCGREGANKPEVKKKGGGGGLSMGGVKREDGKRHSHGGENRDK